VELLFDDVSTRAVQHVGQRMSDASISSSVLADIQTQPHVSLAAFRGLDVAAGASALRELAEEVGLAALMLDGVGTFSGDRHVVFAAPVVTPELRAWNRRCHALLGDFADTPDPLYLPDNWVPHCTLAMEVRPDRVAEALEIAGGLLLPMEVKVQAVAVVSFWPVVERFRVGVG
jgi:2'-5' RNA ligase